MTTYISILRGINVSGHKKILMSDLKSLYEEAGFKNVSTYIQSGNVIFQFPEEISNEQIEVKIRQAILQKYRFDVPVIVRTVNEMQKTCRNNPFLGKIEINIEKLHVTFLAELPKQELLSAINKYDYTPDKFVIIWKDVILYCPNGYGETKLSNTFFENKLHVTATTRNWKTINKLAEFFKE